VERARGRNNKSVSAKEIKSGVDNKGRWLSIAVILLNSNYDNNFSLLKLRSKL
jgi:hypothetical protein